MADCPLVGAGSEEVRGRKSYFAGRGRAGGSAVWEVRPALRNVRSILDLRCGATCLRHAFAPKWRITMRAARAYRPAPEVCVRPARADDLVALLALEDRAFTGDRMSRRSMRRFLYSPHAQVNVAELDRDLIGHSLILFRPNSAI